MTKLEIRIETCLLNHLAKTGQTGLAREWKQHGLEARHMKVSEYLEDAITEQADQEACEALEWLVIASNDLDRCGLLHGYPVRNGDCMDNVHVYLSSVGRTLWFKLPAGINVMPATKEAVLRYIALGCSVASREVQSEILEFFRNAIVYGDDTVKWEALFGALRIASGSNANPGDLADFIAFLSHRSSDSEYMDGAAEQAVPVLAHGLVRNMNPRDLARIIMAVQPMIPYGMSKESYRLLLNAAVRIKKLEETADKVARVVADSMKCSFKNRFCRTRFELDQNGDGAVVCVRVELDEDEQKNTEWAKPIMDLATTVRDAVTIDCQVIFEKGFEIRVEGAEGPNADGPLVHLVYEK
jgi:hypothetical protein